jgi:hypothetical protein
MAIRVLLEEYHLHVYIAGGLPAKELDVIRRALGGPAFRERLRRAVRRAFRGEPALGKVRLRLSR